MATQTFVLNFIKNPNLVAEGDTATLQVTPPDQSAASALAANRPFGRQQVDFTHINASAAGSTSLAFDTGRGQVGFSGSANASARVSVFPQGSDAVTALDLDADVPLALDLPQDAATHYDLVQFELDGQASVSGQIALGAAGAVTFGVDGSATAISAVIRRFADGELGSAEELKATFAGLILPSQVKNADQLKPGTWAVAETEGALNLSLGAQYGLNYNWVRATKLGGLSGDIGLKLQLGVSATLGLQVAGKYAVIVSRESLQQADQTVRVRIFKLARHGFDFAFDAGITATPSTGSFTPANLNDFIQAVVGTHGAQVVKVLSSLESWDGTTASLSGILAQTGNDYVLKLVKDLTGVDPATQLTQAKTELQNFITRWTDLDSLNHNLVTRLLDFVSRKVDLAPVIQAARIVASGDSAGLQQLVADKLTAAGFAQTPLAQFLEALGSRSILSLLQSNTAFSGTAKAVLGILDGSEIQTILTNFEQRLAGTLGVTNLIQAVEAGLQQADFNKLDLLLQARLAGLIDKKLNELGGAEITTIGKALKAFLDSAQNIYDAVVKALNHDYKAELTATYQASSTGTAMVDVEFDFTREDAAGTLAALLQAAIAGKFAGISAGGRTRNLLEEQIPGVQLHQGSLTHGLQRHTHVELNLPYFLNISDHVSSSQAQFFVDKDANRVFVSNQAQSTVSKQRSDRYRRDGTLGIVLQFPGDAAGNITLHDKSGFSYSYQLRQFTKNTTTPVLANQLAVLTGSYFGPFFGDGGTRQSLGALVSGIDAATGGVVNRIGQTAVSLDVSLPAALASNWLLAEPDQAGEQARIRRLSMAVQTAMRRIVPFVHFQDTAKFTTQSDCSAYLLYAACDPVTDIAGLTALLPDISTTVLSAANQANLKRILRAISVRLTNTPDFQASDFNFNVDRIIADGTFDSITQKPALNALRGFFGMENNIVNAALSARKSLKNFEAHIAADPDQAIASMSDFGLQLVESFNKHVADFGGSADVGVQALGTLVFVEATLALATGGDTALLPNIFAGGESGSRVSAAGITALLEVAALKPGAKIPDGFFTGDDLNRDDTTIQVRVFNQIRAAAAATGR